MRSARARGARLLVEAVDRRAGGVDERRERVERLHALEERDEPGDVGLDVGVRVLDGVADPGLRGEVEHVRRAAEAEDLREGLAVVQVRLDRVDTCGGGAAGWDEMLAWPRKETSPGLGRDGVIGDSSWGGLPRLPPRGLPPESA